MKKALCFALLVITNTISAAEPAHTLICNPKKFSDKPNEEVVDCNAVCMKYGGWSQKAIISNTDEFKGILCLCSPAATRTSANEATYDYVPKPVSATGITGKCWFSGWSGDARARGVKPNGLPIFRTFTVSPGAQYCTDLFKDPVVHQSGKSDSCTWENK